MADVPKTFVNVLDTTDIRFDPPVGNPPLTPWLFDEKTSKVPLDKIPGVKAPSQKIVHYVYLCDVFVIFRPWETCPACLRKLRKKDDQGEVYLDLPETGDIVCPHTRKAEYIALGARLAKGEGKVVGHRVEILSSGVVQVFVEWGEPKEK
jgi:hypothetical protein